MFLLSTCLHFWQVWFYWLNQVIKVWWSRVCLAVYSERRGIFFLEAWLLFCACIHWMLDTFDWICSHPLQRRRSLWSLAMRDLLSQHVSRGLLLVGDLWVWSKLQCLQIDPTWSWFRDLSHFLINGLYRRLSHHSQFYWWLLDKGDARTTTDFLLDSDTKLVDPTYLQANDS